VKEVLIADPLTDNQARVLAATLLGSPVESVSQVPASAEHQVFRIQRAGLISFLKVAQDVHIKPELAVLQLLASRGVPVPAIEAADPDGTETGIPCALIRHVGGTPLSHDSPEFPCSGQVLRQVHDIAAAGYGSLASGPAGLHGQDDAWQDTVKQRTHELEPIARAGLIDPALLARAISAVEDNASLLSAPKPGRLLHGDFHPRHVYADGGRITGVIDWGDASIGDPLYDFGRVLHSAVLLDTDLRRGKKALDLVRKTYGDDASWLEGDTFRQVLTYGVIFALSAMRSEFAGGSPWPPWWPVQASGLATMLDAL
jgi:aminoglycoside phosphotransferase (APT) family kinase protein